MNTEKKDDNLFELKPTLTPKLCGKQEYYIRNLSTSSVTDPSNGNEHDDMALG